MTEIHQKILIANKKLFLHGIAGAGKTTLGTQRFNSLLNGSNEDGGILILLPQRSLANPYKEIFDQHTKPLNRQVDIITMSGLVRRLVELFWLNFSDISGFYAPYQPPVFLTLETSQYYMGHLLDPFLEKGCFSTVRLSRNRLLSQLIDNINKSAIVGFPYTKIGEKLISSWVGEESQKKVYADVQELINAFRSFCLQNNLLDFSLQVELFKEHVWTSKDCRDYLRKQYAHLIYDNCEEDPPYVHDVIQEWWPDFKSALVIKDDFAGYHSFLAADPISANRFKNFADDTICINGNKNENLIRDQIARTLIDINKPVDLTLNQIQSFISHPKKRIRFYPELLEVTTEKIKQLVSEGIDPREIVVVSPFVSDSTVFSLDHSLQNENIKLCTLRPSSALLDQPVIKTLLVFAILSHPEWELPIDPFVLSSTLSFVIPALDLVRSHILIRELKLETPICLPELNTINKNILKRLNQEQIQALNQCIKWINSHHNIYPLDVYISRLFGELLSQPLFGFHNSVEAGKKTARLISSFKKFRLSFGKNQNDNQFQMAKEFVLSIQSGLLSATYIDPKSDETENAVLITPVMSFLSLNKAVDYQIWLNVGSSSWYERLEQPLSHPYVLSRQWKDGRLWTADDDITLSRQTLSKIISGLLNRCKKGVYLGMSDYNEAGNEERGLLLKHIQALYRRAQRNTDES